MYIYVYMFLTGMAQILKKGDSPNTIGVSLLKYTPMYAYRYIVS